MPRSLSARPRIPCLSPALFRHTPPFLSLFLSRLLFLSDFSPAPPPLRRPFFRFLHPVFSPFHASPHRPRPLKSLFFRIIALPAPFRKKLPNENTTIVYKFLDIEYTIVYNKNTERHRGLKRCGKGPSEAEATGGRRHKYRARQAASDRRRRMQREGTRRQGRRSIGPTEGNAAPVRTEGRRRSDEGGTGRKLSPDMRLQRPELSPPTVPDSRSSGSLRSLQGICLRGTKEHE